MFANCSEILRKVWKFFKKILLNNWIFILILFLILFFENLLLKIEPSEIIPFFYNNFFRFRGAGIFPFPPGYALAANYIERSERFFNRFIFRILDYFSILKARVRIILNYFSKFQPWPSRRWQEFRKKYGHFLNFMFHPVQT